MNTIDWNHVMESNESWFEDVDDSCPFCQEGYTNFEDLTEEQQRAVAVAFVKEVYYTELEEEWNEHHKGNDTAEDYDAFVADDERTAEVDAFVWEWYDNYGTDDTEIVDWYDDDRETHEHECDECGGNDRFEVMWNTGFEVDLPYSCSFEEKRKLAWEHGWLLVEYPAQSGDHWLLAGGCGYDFSWKLHHARWKLQGWLEPEDRERILSNWSGHVFLHGEKKREFLAYLRTSLPTPATAMHDWMHANNHLMMIEAKSDRDRYPNGMTKRPGYAYPDSTLLYHVTVSGDALEAPHRDAVLETLRLTTGRDNWIYAASRFTLSCDKDAPLNPREIARAVQSTLAETGAGEREVKVKEEWLGTLTYKEPALVPDEEEASDDS